MNQSFSIRAVYKEAYAIIKPKFWTIIGQYLLIFFVLSFLFSILLGRGAVLGSIVTAYIGIKWSLAYVNKGTFSFDDLFENLSFKKFTYFILAIMLVVLSVVGGFILLIIPGIIFAVRLMFTKYIIIETNMTPMEALKESKRITKGVRWKLFWLSVISLFVILLGVLCLLVGVIFAAPLVSLATAIVYKKLRDQAQTQTADEPEVIVAEVVEVVQA
jgi:uncharacterized membrane protein